jgi:serine/threonine protein kinase/predicted ATPase/DNA-binding SARP family transcriptional activator
MEQISFYLFGPPRLEREDRAVPINRRKMLALLAYLVITGQAHSRETLATLFWPDFDSSSALANLRRDLSRLKEILGDGYLQIERDKVQVKPEANWFVDTIQFETLLHQAEEHGHYRPGNEIKSICEQCQSLLESAANLYTGDFMAGFTLSDSPGFDDWQFYQNERLRGQLVGVLGQLIQWRIAQGAYEEAIEHARRWLGLDTLHEPAQRLVMQLYAWIGQPSSALRQYNLLVELLDKELGVEPEPETTALYEAIRTRRVSPPEQVKQNHPISPPQGSADHKFTDPGSEGDPAYLEASRRYIPETLLAKGGFGEVYQGRDQLTGKKVAIKRLLDQLVKQKPEMLERFMREREALSRLSHPNIVPMLDFFEQNGEYNLVMEYISGGSLRERIEKGPELSFEQSLDVAIELADALSRAHHLNILHRDIKPENILLDAAGHPRLIDFGLALLDAQNKRLTQAGMLIGSPTYMSPEALKGQELDARSDIWSFGILLYEMLAGKPPFVADHFHALMQQIMHQDLPSLREYCPDIPEDLEKLIAEMLEKEREKRLPSMRQVAAVLESIRSREKRIKDPTIDQSEITPVNITPGLFIPQTGIRLLELPLQPTPLIGREKELLQLHDLLMNPDCRLVTLVGTGGIGKTRLAIEVAARTAEALPNGAVFVPLAAITEVENILQAIASALHIRYSPGVDPKIQLFRRLSEQKMLLVLDNFEQLLPASDLLANMLAAAPNLRLIVTSRERLNIIEEWIYEVQGLPFPKAGEPISGGIGSWLVNFSAVQLFVERARRVMPNLAVDEDNLMDIIHICQLVEGMPLALELAAPWVRVMSCKEIAHELEQGLDLLTASLRNLPERHRSIRVIFDQSWLSLSQKEQTTLARLSVFYNGWTREAAEAVAAARLSDLTALVDKALLRFHDNRYEMHELVRQYATERLAENPQQQNATLDQHHRYYLKFVAQATPWLKGGRQIEASHKIISDIDNIRSAWRRAVQQRDFDPLFQAAEAYWLFHEFSGFLMQGEAAFRLAADSMELDQPDNGFHGFFRVAQGSLLARQWHFNQGRSLMEMGLAQLRKAEPQDPEKIAFSLAWLSFLDVMHGQYPEGLRSAEESLTYFPQTGDRWTQAGSLRLLGAATLYQGRLQQAQEHLNQCVEVCKSIGELRIRTYATSNLGVIHLWYGQINEARQFFNESLRISKSCNDRLARADALCERGRLFIATGEFDLAIETARSCINLYQELGRTRVSLANILLGKSLRLKGVDGAEEAIQEGLEAAQLVGHRPDIAAAFEGLGALALDQKEYELADQYFQQSLQIWEEIGHEPEISFILCRICSGLIESSTPDHARIRSLLVRAFQLARKHQAGTTAITAMVGLEVLRVLAGEPHQAEKLMPYAYRHPATTFEVRRWLEKFMSETGMQDPSTSNITDMYKTSWQELAERWDKLPEQTGI